MKLFKMLKDKSTLVNENMQIRKTKLELETKLEEADEIKNKYIKILEQKSEQFDLYITYQNQCIELTNDKKELKKELSEVNENNSILTNTNEELTKKIEKLERKIKRLEDKNEKSKR